MRSFCWWVVVVLDHFSRRAMGFHISRRQPTTRAVQAFLDRTIQETGETPKYLISDKGAQFWRDNYKAWCRSRGIDPRFGAVGQHGSIAVVERFIRTLKEGCTRQIVVLSRRQDFRNHIGWFLFWYNEFRPHMTLEGKTPSEVYHARPPANEQPRIRAHAGRSRRRVPSHVFRSRVSLAPCSSCRWQIMPSKNTCRLSHCNAPRKPRGGVCLFFSPARMRCQENPWRRSTVREVSSTHDAVDGPFPIALLPLRRVEPILRSDGKKTLDQYSGLDAPRARSGPATIGNSPWLDLRPGIVPATTNSRYDSVRPPMPGRLTVAQLYRFPPLP